MIRLGNIEFVRHESLVEVPPPKPRKFSSRKEQDLGCPYPDKNFNIISVLPSTSLNIQNQLSHTSNSIIEENQEQDLCSHKNEKLKGKQDGDTGEKTKPMQQPVVINNKKSALIEVDDNKIDLNNDEKNIKEHRQEKSKGLMKTLMNFFQKKI